jgi:DNA modification methylase
LLKPGGVLVYNHKNRYKNHKLIRPTVWLDKTNADHMHEFVWDRGSTHENGRTHPHPVTEQLYVLTKKGERGFYAPAFDKSIENPSVVWRINRQKENLHNAAFPLELAEKVVSLYSPKGGLVSDVYSGSGTTMLACANLGRSFIGCEQLQKNFDISISRFLKSQSNIEFVRV